MWLQLRSASTTEPSAGARWPPAATVKSYPQPRMQLLRILGASRAYFPTRLPTLQLSGYLPGRCCCYHQHYTNRRRKHAAYLPFTQTHYMRPLGNPNSKRHDAGGTSIPRRFCHGYANTASCRRGQVTPPAADVTTTFPRCNSSATALTCLPLS